jgi:hypothetical protein
MVPDKIPEQKKNPGNLFVREWVTKNRWLVTGIAVIVVVLIIMVLVMTLGSKAPVPVSSAPVPANSHTLPATKPVASGTLKPATPEPEQKPVDFVLQPGDTVNCGLTCRQLTASITNSGYDPAHNVCISLHMTNSKGIVIGLNGAGTYQKCIGDLDAGQTKSEPVTINADCGMFALNCVKETLTLQTVVSSDEATVRFPDTNLAV